MITRVQWPFFFFRQARGAQLIDDRRKKTGSYRQIEELVSAGVMRFVRFVDLFLQSFGMWPGPENRLLRNRCVATVPPTSSGRWDRVRSWASPRLRFLRKDSVSRSLTANPTIANCLAEIFFLARLRSAGISFRLVRSPVAPKITMTQGAAVAPAKLPNDSNSWSDPVSRSRGSGSNWLQCPAFFSTWPPNWKRIADKQLCRKISFTPRCEPLVQRRAQYRRGRSRFDRRQNCPAPFAGIGNAAGVMLQRRLFEQRNGG